MFSILIIEDHLGFANALQRLLARQPDLEVVGVIQSAEEALKILHERKVDLVLVDVSPPPPMNGIDIAQQIMREFPALRCLMLSGHISPKYVKRSLDVGACGYILKEDVDGILEGIRRAMEGGIYLSQALQSEE